MDQLKYLERINYNKELSISFEVLANLHRLHLLSIPFENLDIINGKKIDLQNSFDKIITNSRGGFCYELNGLFYDLLKKIGFKVKLVSARVYETDKRFGPEFDHMLIIANINSVEYLTDVGFGEFIFQPLKMELNKIQTDVRGEFIIEPYDSDYMIVKKNISGEYIPEYIFSNREREIHEFNEMFLYHQTNSNSHFTQKRLCSLPTDFGRMTISGNNFKIRDKEKVTDIDLSSDEEYNKVLMEYFKIKL